MTISPESAVSATDASLWEQVTAWDNLVLASGEGVLDDEYEMVYFPGDDLIARLRPRGLPIGNLSSQFWSNGAP